MAPHAKLRSRITPTTVSALLVAAFPGCTTSLHSTKAACAQARVAGKTVCLRPHERCDSRYERIYRSYGLTCKRGVDGSRLRERNYVGPPNP